MTSASRPTPPTPPARPLPRELTLAFTPLHKAAFGVAVGTVSGLLVFGVTVLSLVRHIDHGFLALLAHYFPGYTVSWTGALLGAVWAGFVGFVFGWFGAFSRNLVIAVSLLIIKSRVEREQTRDFLDHI